MAGGKTGDLDAETTGSPILSTIHIAAVPHARDRDALIVVSNLENDPVIAHANAVRSLRSQFQYTYRARLGREGRDHREYAHPRCRSKRVDLLLGTGRRSTRYTGFLSVFPVAQVIIEGPRLLIRCARFEDAQAIREVFQTIHERSVGIEREHNGTHCTILHDL